MKRLLACLLVFLAGWLVTSLATAHGGPPSVSDIHVYAYDTPHHHEPTNGTVSERGPPELSEDPGTQLTADLWSPGLVAPQDSSWGRVGYAYDGADRFVRPEGSRSTGPEVVSVDQGDISTSAQAGVAANSGATNFVGRKGVTKHFEDGSSTSYGGEINIARGTNAPGVVNGRSYSGHAFDQMQGRGVTPSVVDDTIGSGVMSRGADSSRIFYSSENNISVVVNSDGRVITVGYGAFKPR